MSGASILLSAVPAVRRPSTLTNAVGCDIAKIHDAKLVSATATAQFSRRSPTRSSSGALRTVIPSKPNAVAYVIAVHS